MARQDEQGRQGACQVRLARDRPATGRRWHQGRHRTLVHDEEEPAGTSGSNDSRDNAEPITGFGTGKKQSPKLRILGSMPNLAPAPTALAPVAEDNGSIPLAGSTGINGSAAKTTSGVLGDGPHGTAGDDTNDFDFYSLTTTAGMTITVDTSGSGQTDTVVGLYSAAGELLAVDDDGGDGFNSLLSYPVTANGTYYVMVAGYSIAGPLPDDPMDSGSGNGGAISGNYVVSIGSPRSTRTSTPSPSSRVTSSAAP